MTVLSLASLGLYLLTSQARGYLGFPLDDAWIHQTYARNLAATGQFAFIPGQPSAGSTSPLWSAMLAVGYALRMDYRLWTYALGGLLLGLNAWLGHRLSLSLWPERRAFAWLAGAFIALEWHLAWAAASGMETLLFAALALAAFVIPPQRAGWAGLCVGLSILARPDGLTLLPFTLLRLMLDSPRSPARLIRHLLGFGLAFAPYLAFNYALGGSIWPNTFAAKQAEYAVLREVPLLVRLGQVGAVPWVGAQALLLPGIAAAGWVALRRRQAGGLLPLAWAGAFILAYALRLPVTYQHGRYVIPVLPVLIVAGVGGLGSLLRLRSPRLAPRVASRGWALATGLLALAFWFVGAGAYARDVGFIENEMVATARWVNQNTAADSLIAAHDIGALGYFGGRQLLDMAGLVSPEVIPFIRDETRLRAWLAARGADYVVTFPSWYPGLVREPAAREVSRTTTPYGLGAGAAGEGENMAVYRWVAGAP